MNHHFHRDRGPDPRGFSIIELLIAIIIIGILVSILIPVIANRSADARLARAAQDLENLANAEERVATDTGYLGRLYILNDVSGGDTVAFYPTTYNNDVIDGILDHGLSGEYYSNGRYLFIDPRTGEFAGGPPTSNTVGDQLYQSLQRNETQFGWHGPYINWQIDNNYADGTGAVYPDGLPDDPWGNNYLFFTREGLVKEPDGTIVAVDDDGYDCKRFDRATLLSLGSNGVPGNGSAAAAPDNQYGQGDDIVRKFGQ